MYWKGDLNLKKIFSAMMFIFILSMNVCFAADESMPDSMDKTSAVSKARRVLIMASTERIAYDIYIISPEEISNAEYARGDYRAYISPTTKTSADLQDVPIFFNTDDNGINRTDGVISVQSFNSNESGIYVVKGIRGLPDLLVSTQSSGDGIFKARVFLITDGKLRLVRFLPTYAETEMRDSKLINSETIAYLDDGTLGFPWFLRSPKESGAVKSVYMLDEKNFILIPAYVNEIPNE